MANKDEIIAELRRTVNYKRGTPFYAMRFVGHKTLADAILEYHVRCKEGFVGVVELHRLLNSL